MNDKLKKSVDALVRLGEVLSQDEGLEAVLVRAASYNPWFTVEFSRLAIKGIIEKMLNAEKLTQWLSRYEQTEGGVETQNIAPLHVEGRKMQDITSLQDEVAKTIGIIMAGNLPLVGFHDFLCAYISGCGIKVKLSGKDEVLFPYVYRKLMEIDPSLCDRSAIIDRLEGFDAVIATGSNNTNRYFEYYFRDYPKILRRNRNSVAILTGDESDDELYALADDIFMYFGFGCRNVSKLYVPEGYDVKKLFPHFERYKWMHSHTKYMNNYDYNRTLLLMNRTEHLANEIIMLEQNTAISSPVAVLYYETYGEPRQLADKLQANSEHIQCIVSSTSNVISTHVEAVIPFGQTQMPELWDYADMVDTLAFCRNF